MDLIKIRRDLHRIPELGKIEFRTSDYIYDIAKKFPCKIYRIDTGIICYFSFNKPSSICFRADIDALQIEEDNNVEYKSLLKGYMHACGHDGHTAMLLGFLEYVSTLKDYPYNIVLLFQPSEEVYGGSHSIVKSKILDKLKVTKMFSQHIWPNLEKGRIYTKTGGILAQSGEVNIKIKGKSVHAANKKEGIDAILIGARFLLAMEEFDEGIKEKHIIHFGRMIGEGSRNSVSNEVLIQGTIRSYDENIFVDIQNKIKEVIKELENKYHANINLEIISDFPSVYNNPFLVEKMKHALILQEGFMQAEDFGVYTKLYPSVFFLLGTGENKLLHTSTFNFDENILYDGVNNFIQVLENLK